MQQRHLTSRADFSAHTAAILAETDPQAQEDQLLFGLRSVYHAHRFGDWPNGCARLVAMSCRGNLYDYGRVTRILDQICSRENYNLAGETALWLLHDREPAVREGALNLLGLLGDLRKITPLLGLLASGDHPLDPEQIRDTIEDIEASQNNTRGTYGFLDSTDDLLARLQDPHDKHKGNFIPVLALRHDDPRVVPALLAAYEAVEPKWRSSIINALCAMPRDTQTILPHLLRWYHAAETDRKRRMFLYALATHGDERVLPILLNRPEPETMSINAQIDALGLLGDPGSGPLLAQYVETAPGQSLDHAIHALSSLKDAQYFGLICQRMLDAPTAVANALGELGGDLARETLLVMHYHTWPDEQRPLQIQRATVDALGSLRDPAVIPHLEPLLYDTSWALALGAAKSLENIGSPDARMAQDRWMNSTG